MVLRREDIVLGGRSGGGMVVDGWVEGEDWGVGGER